MPATWIETYKGKKGTTYTVRWREGDEKPRRTFKDKAKALAFQSLVEGGRLPEAPVSHTSPRRGGRFIAESTVRKSTKTNYEGTPRTSYAPSSLAWT